LDNFKCIGSYSEAETKDAFKTVLKTVIDKVLINTSAQINLNNSAGLPKETDVTIFMYKAGTKELKYTFEHTLNAFNNPDTLTIDPSISYDVVVNTIPLVEKKNVQLKKNTHNTIIVDCPQGFIQLRYTNATKPFQLESRITQSTNAQTINTQKIGTTDKYIVGSYNLEILSLPRIYQTVLVNQSSTTYVDIPAPGVLNYSMSKPIAGQLFVKRENGNYDWVCNIDPVSTKNTLLLQPGEYKVVYRQKQLKSTSFTTEKSVKIQSNKTSSINL
jgi:Ca-activated chloride channel family protein